MDILAEIMISGLIIAVIGLIFFWASAVFLKKTRPKKIFISIMLSEIKRARLSKGKMSPEQIVQHKVENFKSAWPKVDAEKDLLPLVKKEIEKARKLQKKVELQLSELKTNFEFSKKNGLEKIRELEKSARNESDSKNLFRIKENLSEAREKAKKESRDFQNKEYWLKIKAGEVEERLEPLIFLEKIVLETIK